jgi:hypothetical protein
MSGNANDDGPPSAPETGAQVPKTSPISAGSTAGVRSVKKGRQGNLTRRSVSMSAMNPGEESPFGHQFPVTSRNMVTEAALASARNRGSTMLTRKKSTSKIHGHVKPPVVEMVTFYVQQLLRLGRKEHATLEIDLETHKVKIVKARSDKEKKSGKESEKAFNCTAFTKFEKSGKTTLSVTISDGTHSGKGTVKKFSFINEHQRDEFVSLVKETNSAMAAFLRNRASVDIAIEDRDGVLGSFVARGVSASVANSEAGQRSFLNLMLRNKKSVQIGELAAPSLSDPTEREDSESGKKVTLYHPFCGETTKIVCSHTTLVLYRSRVDKSLRRISFNNLYPKSIPVRGELILTQFRLIFNAYETLEKHDLEYPVTAISSIKKQGTTVFLALKHTAFSPQFIFSNSSVFDSFLVELDTYAFLKKPARPEDYFAFQYKLSMPKTSDGEEGNGEGVQMDKGQGRSVTSYDSVGDYIRIGLLPPAGEAPKKKRFRLVRNSKYSLSQTYPSKFIVPTEVNDKMLGEVAKYRSKERIPVVTWLHKKSKGLLVRCAQPMRGFNDSRCTADEKYFTILRKLSGNIKKLLIVDARAGIAATANRGRGKGTENLQYYENSDRQYCDIGNIHTMRQSVQALHDLCEPTTISAGAENWWTQVEQTGWLKHVGLVMLAANDTACSIESGQAVVVHCSDGWDRTAQICALAEMMLDPFYRTLEGFGILVEKHWCSFGHKFHDRCGHGDANPSSVERSPIFLQFLDCVWQYKCQFPTIFEFNKEYLLTLADELNSCKYGTFLFNSELDREMYRVFKKTVSIWEDIEMKRDEFVDPIFKAVETGEVFYPEISSRNIKLWEEFYCRRANKRV